MFIDDWKWPRRGSTEPIYRSYVNLLTTLGKHELTSFAPRLRSLHDQEKMFNKIMAWMCMSVRLVQ